MIGHLPSMSGLRAFEAVARHLSFTRAADELNLTQTAVSHQINKLENLLKIKLFIRKNNQVRLSDVGKEYLGLVSSEIDGIIRATESIVDRNKKPSLSIACYTAFCIKRLNPLLSDFQSRHPGIAVNIETEVLLSNYTHINYDISIQYGLEGDWPELVSYQLNKDELFPVCSPSLLSSLKSVEDLKRHTLIEASAPTLKNDWPIWLKQAGLGNAAVSNRISYVHLLPALQAAIEGLGVTMTREMLSETDMAAGRLVEPFSVRVKSDAGYHLVIRPDRIKLPHVVYFRDWLLSQFS